MEENRRGLVYILAGGSNTTMVFERETAKPVMFEDFAFEEGLDIWLAEEGPREGYQQIITYPPFSGEDEELELYGVFVFEGANLGAVKVALAEEWAMDVELVEDVEVEFMVHHLDPTDPDFVTHTIDRI